MRFLPTELEEVIVVEPRIHRDERGSFRETYHRARFEEAGIGDRFVQDNHSCSASGTLRGLHAQVRRPQAKLIRVVAGEVLDVAVDIRRGSPTFGRWVAVSLDADSGRMLYIPEGFAHGFCVTGETAEVVYKCSALYDPDDEIAIRWDDPELAIRWPLSAPKLSPRDAAAPTLAEIEDRLPAYSGAAAR